MMEIEANQWIALLVIFAAIAIGVSWQASIDNRPKKNHGSQTKEDPFFGSGYWEPGGGHDQWEEDLNKMRDDLGRHQPNYADLFKKPDQDPRIADPEGLRKSLDELRAMKYQRKDPVASLKPTPGATAHTTGPKRPRPITEKQNGQ